MRKCLEREGVLERGVMFGPMKRRGAHTKWQVEARDLMSKGPGSGRGVQVGGVSVRVQ